MGLTLGFIGLGRMGQPMALRLLGAGFRLRVWNREPERLQPVVERGAIACDSPADVACGAEILIACVLDAESVEAVLFGAGGVASAPAAERTDRIFVDHASVSPEATRDLAARLRERTGMRWVDAPVSGTVVGAEKGTLAVMCGGDAQDVERVRPALAAYAGQITHMGSVGAGQIAKLCNQVLVASTMCAVAEAVRLAERSGLDPALLPQAFAGGAADSPILRLLVPRMITPHSDSLGASRVLLKDLDAVLATAREVGVPLPVTNTVRARFQRMVELGKGDEEPSRLIDLLDGTDEPKT